MNKNTEGSQENKKNKQKFSFTSIKAAAQQLVEKSRPLKSAIQEQFIQSIKEEVDYQKELAQSFPDIVLNIKSLQFKIIKNLLKKEKIKAIVTYQCDNRCMPILEYVKQLTGINTLEQKLKICYQLFAIAVWIGQTAKTHRNLKPSNIFYYENKVLLSDFGSKRTFYQHYIADFTEGAQIDWQKHYQFYNSEKFLKCISNVVEKELFDWGEVQTLEMLIQQDLWAIGLIILEIFSPIEEINTQAKKNIQLDIKEFYGMNQGNLDIALKIFYSKTKNETLLHNLKRLLEFKVNDIELDDIKNSIKQQDELLYELSSSFQVLNSNQSIDLILQTHKEIDIKKYQFSSMKEFKSLNIILVPTQQEVQIVQKTKIKFFKFMSILQKQKDLNNLKNVQDSKLHENFLCYDSIIYLNLNEAKNYKSRLIKAKEFYGKQTKDTELNLEQIIQFLDRAIQQIHWREQALKLHQNKNLKAVPLLGYLLFYLNFEEYRNLIEREFFKEFENNNNSTQKTYLERKIKLRQKIWEQTLCLQIEGDNRFDHEEFSYITIRTLEQSQQNKKGLLFDLYNLKLREKQKNGIEILKFNLYLGGNTKCLKFIGTGQYQYILESFYEFRKLSPDFKEKYKEKLQNQIKVSDGDLSKKFYRAQFWLFRDLPYLLHPHNQKPQYNISNLKIQYKFDDLDEKINSFYLDMVSKHLTIEREHDLYLKQLDLIQYLQIEQIIDDSPLQCIYSGFQIGNRPNGIGFTKINNQYLQFGIYENNQLIWGWSIYLKNNYLYCQKGVFEKQGNGKGAIKKFSISYQNNQYTFELKDKRKGHLQNWRLEGKGTKKKVKDQKQTQQQSKNQNQPKMLQMLQIKSEITLEEGYFISNKLEGMAIVYFNNCQTNLQQGNFNKDETNRQQGNFNKDETNEQQGNFNKDKTNKQQGNFNKDKTNWQQGNFSKGIPIQRHLIMENEVRREVNYDKCCSLI